MKHLWQMVKAVFSFLSFDIKNSYFCELLATLPLLIKTPNFAWRPPIYLHYLKLGGDLKFRCSSPKQWFIRPVIEFRHIHYKVP